MVYCFIHNQDSLQLLHQLEGRWNPKIPEIMVNVGDETTYLGHFGALKCWCLILEEMNLNICDDVLKGISNQL
jgi:hypothetical protein